MFARHTLTYTLCSLHCSNMADLCGLTVGGHSITTPSLSPASVSMALNPQTVTTVVCWSQAGGTATSGEIKAAHGL